MRKAYKPPENLSNSSPALWRAALYATGFVIIGGLVIIILALAGVADPPRAGSLYWRAQTARDWKRWQDAGDFALFFAPVVMPAQMFTLEVTADNNGADDSAWGCALQITDRIWAILVSREGYFSISTDEYPHWSEFIHIRRDAANEIYLNITQNGTAIVRINDEIAWTGELSIGRNATWGIATYRNPQITWKMIEIYAS